MGRTAYAGLGPETLPKRSAEGYSFLMGRFLILAALAAAAPAAAQFDAVEGYLRELAAAAKARAEAAAKASAPAAVDRGPINALLDHVLREGSPVETAEGPADAIEGVALPLVAGERLTVGAVLDLDAEEQAEPAVRDLLYRRAFRNLFAVRQVTRDAGDGCTRVESWTYHLGFEGSLLPVVHTVIVTKPQPGAVEKVFFDLDRSSTEKIPAADPAAQEGWKELAPRLLRLAQIVAA